MAIINSNSKKAQKNKPSIARQIQGKVALRKPWFPWKVSRIKAQAHIEVILAFVLFISAITIFFLLFKPLSPSILIPIQDTQDKITNTLSDNVGKLSAIVKTNTDCYSLTNVNPDYGNNFIEIKDPANTKRYTIYYHPTLTQSTISCGIPIDSTVYKLGLYSTENFFIKNKITTLKHDYETDYTTLKSTLNLKTDFSFSFKDLYQNTIPELTPTPKTPPVGINIISNDLPVRVIDSNGFIQELILNIRAW